MSCKFITFSPKVSGAQGFEIVLTVTVVVELVLPRKLKVNDFCHIETKT